MPTSIVQKRCSCCKETKEPDEFYRDKSHIDGRYPQCRDCRRAAMRRYRQSPKAKAKKAAYRKTDKYKATQVRYMQSEKGKAVRKRASKRCAKKYPQKIKPRHAVHYAVATGRLPRPDTLYCRDCGEPAEHYHHHKGYAPEHWLDVEALCRKCHKAEEKKLKNVCA